MVTEEIYSSGAPELGIGERNEQGAIVDTATGPCDAAKLEQRRIDSDEDTIEPLILRATTDRKKGKPRSLTLISRVLPDRRDGFIHAKKCIEWMGLAREPNANKIIDGFVLFISLSSRRSH